MGCCFLEFEQTIVCIADLGYFINSSDYFITSFSETFRDNNFRIGYSNEFRDINNLRSHYEQAKIALRTGLAHAPSLWSFKFSDMVLHYMRSKVTEDLDEEFLCAPELVKLYKYDKENQSDYLHTLKTYFDNHMNVAKTAIALFIHRATMIYRLDRIRELTGIDFKNQDRILYLTISVKLLMDE